MPKARSGNFTLRAIVRGVSADKAAHRMASLQRSGQYSELRFIQRGKAHFDIVGYKWPDKGVRRRLGIGNARNPESVMKYRLLKWDEATVTGRLASLYLAGADNNGLAIYGRTYHTDLDPRQVKKLCVYLHSFPEDQARTFMAPDLQDWITHIRKMVFKENPSPKNGVTPNQVKFGMRGRTVIGWVNNESPTRYWIAYKVGAQLRHVWRRKDQVTFVGTGRRGRVPNNCPKTATENPDALRNAVALSKRFHGFDPRRIKAVKLDWPKALALLGPCVRLDYFSQKFDGKGRIYFHEFEKPAAVYAAERPQPDGTNLLIIHGRFSIKPEGITG